MPKRPLLIAALGVVAVAGIAAGVTFGVRDRVPSNQEVIDSVDAAVSKAIGTTQLPAFGLGEGSPPPPDALTAAWGATNFSKHSVPFDEISSGGPGPDGIPAIDHPRFVSVADAGFIEDREPVILLEVDGDVRGYPIQILIWHEIVNDDVGGTPVAVTFCPLCNTAIVFDRRVDGEALDFGTTGNLRNSDLVMYDRKTQSWWQQFSGEAIVGDLTGKRLDQLPARIVSWKDFRREYPDAKVLSRATGFDRPYGSNPYSGYDDASTPPLFDAANADDHRLPPKERVVYLEDGDAAVAVPYSLLRERRKVAVEVGDRSLTVLWRPGVASALGDPEIAKGADIGSAQVLEDDRAVAFHEPFWFAVAAFRPGTRVIR